MPQFQRNDYQRENPSIHRTDGLGLAQVPITTGLRPTGLQGLAERLSGHEQRLTSTGLLLQRLEQQLQDELAEANHLAEAQRRSAILANRRTAVPQCEIDSFPAATTSQCAGQICCICDDGFEQVSFEIKNSEAEAKDSDTSFESSDDAKDSGDATESEAKELEARLSVLKVEQEEAGDTDKGLAVCTLPTCGHVFHRHCIGRWLRLKNTCPMCRSVLPTVPKLSELRELGTAELRRRLDHWKINHGDVVSESSLESNRNVGLENASVDPVSDPTAVEKEPQKTTKEAKVLAERLYAHLSARPKGEEPEEGDDDYVAPPPHVQPSRTNEEEQSEGEQRDNRNSEEAVAAIARSISSAMDRRAQRRRLWELERHAAELELAQRMMHYQEATRPLGMISIEEQQRREAVGDALNRHGRNSEGEEEEAARAMEQRHIREAQEDEVLRREMLATAADEDAASMETSSVYPSSSMPSIQGGAPRGLYAYAHSSVDHSAPRTYPLTSFEPRARFGGALSRASASTIPERSAELQQALRDIGEDPQAPILVIGDEQEHGDGLMAAASADAVDADSRVSDALPDPQMFDLLGPGPHPSDEVVDSRDYVVNANPNGTYTITGFRVDDR